MAVIEEKQLRSVREYIKEIAIIGLTIAVIAIFKMYDKLNDYIIHDLSERNTKMEMVIERNTDIIETIKQK